MLRDCALERGMAEGGAVEVEGRFNTSTRTAMWLKGAIVDAGLDAASVDVLCMLLDLNNPRTRAARRRAAMNQRTAISATRTRIATAVATTGATSEVL